MAVQKPVTERPLTVVIPCYNEATTIVEILSRVLRSDLVGQIIVVDDASSDETLRLINTVVDDRITVIAQNTNQGKGAALREGFRHAQQPYVIVQDADLEYNPNEYPRLLRPLLAGEADAVYGSRFRGGREQRVLYFWHTLGNRLLTLASNVATNLNLTDMETCYKVFRRELIQDIDLEQDRFGFEPEITAKLAQRQCRIFEVGIGYYGRTYEDGKKIGWRDGLHAAFCIVRYSRAGNAFGVRHLSRIVGRLTGG